VLRVPFLKLPKGERVERNGIPPPREDAQVLVNTRCDCQPSLADAGVFDVQTFRDAGEVEFLLLLGRDGVFQRTTYWVIPPLPNLAPEQVEVPFTAILEIESFAARFGLGNSDREIRPLAAGKTDLLDYRDP